MDYSDISKVLKPDVIFLLRGKGYRFSCFVERRGAFNADILEVIDLETDKLAFIAYEEVLRALNDGKFLIPNEALENEG